MKLETLPTKIRTFEFTASISGPLDVPFEDWPQNLQDTVWQALEKLAERERLPLKIVYARYKTDIDLHRDAPGYHYVHVVASEIVAAPITKLQ